MKRKVSHKKRVAAAAGKRKGAKRWMRRAGSVASGPGLGSAYGGRTPRLRFIESPTKTFGNPFFAVRVPREVLAAFKRKAKPNPQAAVREFMASVSGVELEVEE